MNAPFILAQATVGSSAGSTQRVVKIAKPQSEQAISLRLDNTARLDLTDIGTEKVTFVHVGDRLVILFDNQSTVTIAGFFDDNGKPLQNLNIEVEGGRVIGGAEFATLFPISDDTSILAAAGSNAGAPNSGANFRDATVDGFEARNALGLLGGEDGNGAGGGLVESLTNTVPRIGTIALGNADDEGLFEGNIGGPGDVPGEATSITVSLNVDFGQDLTNRALAFAATQPGLAGLTSGGEAITLALTVIGGLPALVGYTGVNPADPASHVFTITLNTAPLNGEYTFTLLQPLDHPTAGTEDTITLAVGFVATDGNGDSASGTFQVAVNDDSPTADTVVVGAVTEDVGGPAAIAGASLEISWGADNFDNDGQPIDRSVAFKDTVLAGANVVVTGSDGFAGPLTSNGQPVQYTFVGDVLVGYVGAAVPPAPGASVVFAVEISDKGLKGEYSFTLLQPLDHPAPNGDQHYIDLQFSFVATDSDGDPVSGSFKVEIDANGTIDPTGTTIDYSDLAEGVFINLANVPQIGPSVVFPGFEFVAGNTATDRAGNVLPVVGIDRLGSLIVNATGGHGNDVIIGGNEANILRGLDGDDDMRGWGGNDTLEGGKGDDYLLGDSGDDTLRGGQGWDQLVGGFGNDTMYGGRGNDLMDGGFGNDTMHGGRGDDDLYGGFGDDILNGGRGSDILYGDSGADIMDGGRGDDFLDGGRGDDVMLGGRGDDLMFGGRDDDDLLGGDGEDRLAGEEGNDNLFGDADRDELAYVFASGVFSWNFDVFVGGETGDDYDTAILDGSFYWNDHLTITLTGFESFNADYTDVAGIEVIASEIERIYAIDDPFGGIDDHLLIQGFGGAEDHIILTSNPLQEGDVGQTVIVSVGYENVRIDGNGGADIIDASDYLYGGVDLRGGGGGDEIIGSDQADTIRGGNGDDDLRGGGGDDLFIYNAGDGQDTVRGGGGKDLQEIYGSATSETFNVNAIVLNGQDFVGINILDGITAAENVNADGVNYEVATRNVEDIYIETGAGADKVIIEGDLGPTGLATSTITIEDGAGNSGDTVDARGLTSTHGIEFFGHGGDDTFYVSGAGGDDKFIGGAGSDTIDFSDVGHAVTVDLSDSQAQATGDGSDTIRGVENALGTNFDDTLTGNDDANILTGYGGNDIIEGGLGSDTIIAGAGIDTAVYTELYAGSSADAVFAFNGSNWTVTIGGDTDTLFGVERVTFGDGKTFLLVDHGGDGFGGYQTIQAAVDAANPTDTVLVGGGTYNENVTVSEGITIQGIGAVTVDGGTTGAAFTVDGGGAGQKLVLTGMDVTGGAASVIDVLSSANYDEVTFSHGDVTGGANHGLFLDNATGVEKITIEDATFSGNATQDSGAGEGAIAIYQYNGDVSLIGVTVENPGLQAENGIQIRGTDALAEMGDILFQDVLVNGTYLKTGVAIYNYSDATGHFDLQDVSITVDAGWHGLNIDNVGGIVDLGSPIAISVINTHPGEANDIAMQGLVSGGTQIYRGDDSDDLMVGRGGDDILAGEGGNDLFVYRPGNDVPGTGDGSDLLFGGTGIDTLKIERLTSGANLYVFAGTASGFNVDIDHAGAVVPNNQIFTTEIEKIDLGMTNGDVTRFDGNMVGVTNAVVTGDAGSQILATSFLTSNTQVTANLMGGVDWFYGGTHTVGVNVDGGDGQDLVTYQNIVTPVTIDLVDGTAVRNGVTDLVRNFEDAAGGSGNDTIYGTAGTNFIWGNGGDDTIDARGGADFVDAGAGNDTLIYRLGDGNDQFNGGIDSDTLIVHGDGNAQSFTLTATAPGFDIDTGGAPGTEILTAGIENATLNLAGGSDALTVNGLDTVGETITVAGTAASFTVSGNMLPTTTVNSGEAITINGNGGNDVIDASGLVVTGTPSQAGTVSGPQVKSIGFLGDNAGGAISNANPVSYVAQSFVAKAGSLNALSFTLQESAGSDAVDFRVLLVAWDTVLNRPVVGAPLYESAPLTKAADAAAQTFTVAPDLALVAGQTYAFILDAFPGKDGAPGVVRVSAVTTSAELGGVFTNPGSGGNTLDVHFASTWAGADGWDLAYQMSYGPSMTVTLNGGAGTDTITGSTGNDMISGGADNDTINYTVGNGHDTVDGGTGNADALIVHGDGNAQSVTLAATATGFDVDTDGASGAEVTASNVELATLDLGNGTDALTVTGLDTGEHITLAGTAASFTVTGDNLPTTTVTGDEAITVKGNGGDDIIDASALAITPPADPFTAGTGLVGFNAGSQGNFGEPNSAYYGQTFTAEGNFLSQVSFLVQPSTGLDNVEFRVLLVEWDTVNNRPGTLLYESGTQVADHSPGVKTITVAPNVALVPGHIYAFISDAFSEFDHVSGVTSMPLFNDAGEAGNFVFFSAINPDSDGRPEHFNSHWTSFTGVDQAYTLTYSNTPDFDVTLDGGAGNDDITGSTGNDAIFGGADDDTIRYAVGTGHDLIDGGTGADKLNVTGTNNAETYNIKAITIGADTYLGINIENGAGNNVAATATNYEVATKAVEDIYITTNGGADTVNVVGSLNGTGLLTSTMYINTGDGADTIDLSERASAHRVVADGGADADTVKLGFAYGDLPLSAYEKIFDGTTLIGVSIKHMVGGVDVIDEFRNVENFEFTGGTKNLADLFGTPNHEPTGTSAAIAVTEDVAHVFTLSDFGFHDVDGDSMLNVSVQLPNAGQLLLGNDPLTPGAAISAADIEAGRLVFVPGTDVHSTNIGIQFVVRDEHGAPSELQTLTMVIGDDVLDFTRDGNGVAIGVGGDDLSIIDTEGSQDQISLSTSPDRIFTGLSFERVGAQMELYLAGLTGSRQVTVLSQFDNTGHAYEYLAFAFGSTYIGYQFSVSNYHIVSANGSPDVGAATSNRDIFVGSAANDTMHSGFGNDLVFGGGGNDVLDGGVGNDLLVGGLGNDIIRAGADNDVIDGGDGLDVFDFSDATAGITFVLTQSSDDAVASLSGAGLGSDTYRNMEGVIGSDFADVLTGSAQADIFNGGGGADSLVGGAGSDTLTGGEGADTFKFAEAGAGNVDVIKDYNFGQGDKIDLHGLLDQHFGGGSASDYVQLVAGANANEAKLQVDVDGAGSGGWADVAVLSNYSPASNVLVEFEHQALTLHVA